MKTTLRVYLIFISMVEINSRKNVIQFHYKGIIDRIPGSQPSEAINYVHVESPLLRHYFKAMMVLIQASFSLALSTVHNFFGSSLQFGMVLLSLSPFPQVTDSTLFFEGS